MPKTSPLNSAYDVIVVGAGSGGIAAAIQASRMGVKTLLVEASPHLGGQLLAVPTMDEGQVEGQGYPIREIGGVLGMRNLHYQLASDICIDTFGLGIPEVADSIIHALPDDTGGFCLGG